MFVLSDPKPRSKPASTIDEEQVCRWIDHGGGSHYSERFWTLDPIDGTKGFSGASNMRSPSRLSSRAASPSPRWRVRTCRQRRNRAEVDGTIEGAIFHAVSGQGAYVVAAQTHRRVLNPAPVRLAVSRRDRAGGRAILRVGRVWA